MQAITKPPPLWYLGKEKVREITDFLLHYIIFIQQRCCMHSWSKF